MLIRFDKVVSELADLYARSLGYSSAVSAVSFLNSSNSKYQSEATSVLEYRDFLWAWAEQVQRAGKAGVDSDTDAHILSSLLQDLWKFSKDPAQSQRLERTAKTIDRYLVDKEMNNGEHPLQRR